MNPLFQNTNTGTCTSSKQHVFLSLVSWELAMKKMISILCNKKCTTFLGLFAFTSYPIHKIIQC